MTRARPAAPRRAEQGYVLLTMVLLGALVAAATLSFARHAILAADGAATSMAHERGENAMSSGMAFVAQSLRADGAASLSQAVDGGQLDVAVTDHSSTERLVSVTTADASGNAHTIDALAEVYPVSEGQLPALTDAANAIVRTAPSKMNVATDTRLADTEIAGVILVRRGVRLTLDDVILRGFIVTENALLGSTGDPADDAEIVLEGGLLVQSGTLISGIAIMAPDVIIDGSHPDASLQVHGVVTARGLSMAGPVSIHGQLATELPPVFLDRAEFPGAGREPRPWPDTLAFDTRAVGRLVFRFAEPSAGEKSAIQNFAWPAKGSMGSLSAAQAAKAMTGDG